MTKEKLVAVLSSNISLWNRYRKWLRHFGVYSADLSGADLCGANIYGANLFNSERNPDVNSKGENHA